MIETRILTHKAPFVTKKDSDTRLSWMAFIRKDETNIYSCICSEISIDAEPNIDNFGQDIKEFASMELKEVSDFIVNSLNEFNEFEIKSFFVTAETDAEIDEKVVDWVTNDA